MHQSPFADADDRELVPRLTCDPAALEEFYRRHVRSLMRQVIERVQDPHDADDLVAATFIAAMESAARYDPAKGTPGAWLRGIAGNLMATRWRRAATEARAMSRLAGHVTPAADEFGSIDDRIDAGRQAAPAIAVLDRLPPAERELVDLVLYRDLTVGEAAVALGIRPGTARMRLLRTRARVAAALGRDVPR
jgi:RNA polymerase sigma factor (sigma-70 family)